MLTPENQTEYRVKKRLNTVTKNWIKETWKKYPPEWFVTLLWNDLPTSAVTSSSHTRHFRNVLLCSLCKVKKCRRLPQFPERLGLTVFQERTLIQGDKTTFHTHIHISNTKGIWTSEEEVESFIRNIVGSKVDRLLKSDTKHNRGVVARKWIPEQHMSYNFKEIDRKRNQQITRFTQDSDLLLDVETSDFI